MGTMKPERLNELERLKEEVNQALDEAGCAVGDEHRRYTVVERIENMGKSIDYLNRQLDLARKNLATLTEIHELTKII